VSDIGSFLHAREPPVRGHLEVLSLDPQVAKHLCKQSLADLLLPVLHGCLAVPCVERPVRTRPFRRHETHLYVPDSRPPAHPNDELPTGHWAMAPVGVAHLASIDARIFDRNGGLDGNRDRQAARTVRVPRGNIVPTLAGR